MITEKNQKHTQTCAHTEWAGILMPAIDYWIAGVQSRLLMYL